MFPIIPINIIVVWFQQQSKSLQLKLENNDGQFMAHAKQLCGGN